MIIPLCVYTIMKYVGQIHVKFQAVAEKTAKGLSEITFFATPCRPMVSCFLCACVFLQHMS